MTTFLAPVLPMILVDELAALENKLEEIDISVPDIQVPDVELPPAKFLALLRESPAFVERKLSRQNLRLPRLRRWQLP